MYGLSLDLLPLLHDCVHVLLAAMWMQHTLYVTLSLKKCVIMIISYGSVFDLF